MERIKIADSYSFAYLEIERPQPLTDIQIEKLIQDVLTGKLDHNITNEIYHKFKDTMINWLLSSKLNKLSGLNKFNQIDICIGCTQFIDNLYMQGNVQILKNDYKYHQRLNPNIKFSEISKLVKNVPLLISFPFPAIGDIHPNMNELLDECLLKNIPVHIDGAWITCSKNLVFNFDHPAIHSVGISLSKGLGLGWSRIGLRWSRNNITDSISLMNTFNMVNKPLVMIGSYFLMNLSPDYLWQKHGDRNNKICKDFNLNATKSVHIALDHNNQPVGLSPLIRFLEREES